MSPSGRKAFIIARFTLVLVLLAERTLASDVTGVQTYATAPHACELVTQCSHAKTALEKFECASRVVFRLSDPDKRGYVVHTNGQGWGNTVRSIATVLPYAVILGRPLILNVPYYKRAFLPPDGSKEWPSLPPYNFLPETLALFEDINKVMNGQTLEDVGRIFTDWAEAVRSGKIKYSAPHLSTMCNSGSNIGPTFRLNDCLEAAMPDYHKCIFSIPYPPQELLYIHSFVGLLWYPSPSLCANLAKIRARLDLPLPEGLEPRPGAWGLRTPGYYILALHFRGTCVH